MALSQEAYQGLEAIVGPENISDDPVILDGYAFQMMEGGLEARYGGKFATRPEAVLLPGSTEEVQAIVKACNRYKIKFKAFGTGWGIWGAPSTEGVIQLDLRRMNRILEINEKNMYAVVEPYVSNLQLQVEAQKLGLNPHCIPCPSGSVVATSTSMAGCGSSGLYTGYSGRNVLGVEWILPTGQILRLGSPGSGDGWFCGDGPGPSLRGIMRGWKGAGGGFGVFTKVATKLYAWPGPPLMPIDGVTPHYTTPLPDNFKAYIISFPDFESFRDFWIKIGEAEIGYATHKLLNSPRDAALYMLAHLPTKTKDDIVEVMEMPETRELSKEIKCSCRLILVGHSPRHTEYQDKVLNEILAETKGHIVPFFTEPRMRNALLLSELKHSSANEVFDFSGSHAEIFGGIGSADFMFGRIEEGVELKRKATEEARGKIHIVEGDDTAGEAIEHGQFGIYLGEHCYYDPADLESARAAAKFSEQAAEIVLSKGWPMASLGPVEPVRMSKTSDRFRRRFSDLCSWQTRIKQAFDPNAASDSGNYITVEEGELSGRND